MELTPCAAERRRARRAGSETGNGKMTIEKFRDIIAATEFGDKYSQDVVLYGKKGKPGNVRLGWIVEKDGSVRLTTAHMEEI